MSDKKCRKSIKETDILPHSYEICHFGRFSLEGTMKPATGGVKYTVLEDGKEIFESKFLKDAVCSYNLNVADAVKSMDDVEYLQNILTILRSQTQSCEEQDTTIKDCWNEVFERLEKLQKRTLTEDEIDIFNDYIECNDMPVAFGNSDWRLIYNKIVGGKESDYAKRCIEKYDGLC